MAEKKRMANLELLRCVAMMMVVVLHFLGKGGLLTGGDRVLSDGAVALDGTGHAAWLLEASCIVAVNVYMLISGYFLCCSSFKLSRLIQLWLQVWFYSVAVGVLAAAAGVVEGTAVDVHYYLTLLFPVSMEHYWFMTAYLFLYVLLPVAGLAVRQMTKGQMKAAVLLLLGVFCGLKSVVPFRLDVDRKGYDVLWYLCVFVAAAYLRRFGLPWRKGKWKCLLLYAASCLLAFGGTMILHRVYLRTGKLSWIVNVCMEYNHVLPLLGAVGLFGFFLHVRVPDKIAPVINKVAGCTLGVYLLHENLGLRYAWQPWLGAGEVTGVGSLLARTITSVIIVFACGILVEALRATVEKGLCRVLGKAGVFHRISERILSVDRLFQGGMSQGGAARETAPQGEVPGDGTARETASQGEVSQDGAARETAPQGEVPGGAAARGTDEKGLR